MYKNIDRELIEEILGFVEKKSLNSMMTIKYNSFFMNFIRIIRHYLGRIGCKNNDTSLIVHVTMPYYRHDVKKLPSNVVSLNDFKVSLLELIYTLRFFILNSLSDRYVDLNNRYHSISVLSLAYMNYLSIKKKSPNFIHFHGYSYVQEFSALIYIFSSDPLVETHYHEYSAFPDSSTCVKTDVLVSINEYTNEYILNNKSKYVSKAYKYRKNIANSNLFKQSNVDNANTVGLYMTGFYARKKHGFYESELFDKGILSEKLLINAFHAYAEQNPHITIIIFPHYKRNVEVYKDSRVHYQSIISLPNVLLSKPMTVLSSPMEGVNLGVTVGSTIFWDRLSLGMKTIFVNALIVDDFVNSSVLAKVSLNSESDIFSDDIDRFVKMNDCDFFNEIKLP